MLWVIATKHTYTIKQRFYYFLTLINRHVLHVHCQSCTQVKTLLAQRWFFVALRAIVDLCGHMTHYYRFIKLAWGAIA
jgi:hypothetical protein